MFVLRKWIGLEKVSNGVRCVSFASSYKRSLISIGKKLENVKYNIIHVTIDNWQRSTDCIHKHVVNILWECRNLFVFFFSMFSYSFRQQLKLILFYIWTRISYSSCRLFICGIYGYWVTVYFFLQRNLNIKKCLNCE